MNPNIKALILDVDGVIIGDKVGFNSPHPHPLVTDALKKIRASGIPISLCTAKPHFSIQKEIRDSILNNIHIADGGAVIINPLDGTIIKQITIDSEIASQLIEVLISAGIYVEAYSVDKYYVQKSQISEITDKHTFVLQTHPEAVKDLASFVNEKEITKIMPIVNSDSEKAKAEMLFEAFNRELMLSWGVHPVALPLQFGIITHKSVSKRQGAIEISKSLNIPLENFLGVGDSSSDWQFIELCGFAGAMGNASKELKDNVAQKGIANSFISPSVDDNGILEIFKYFKLH